MNEMVKTGASVAKRARQEFDTEQVQLIRDTVAKDATLPELHLFLELAARYQLDPFAGQIWCAKMGGENASGGRMSIMVGRDGFLTIANRHDDFEGMDGDVVRANDDFRVELKDGKRVVHHSYTTTTETAASFEGDGQVEADDGRGPIIGAWATVERRGRKPTYFFARWDEYVPRSEAKRTKTPWGVQESAMILKCAQSTALRLAFNITGLVGAEEAARQLMSGAPEAEDDFDLSMLPEDRQEHVRGLLDEANERRPGAYRPARVKLMFSGKSVEEQERVVADIKAFVENNEGAAPPETDVSGSGDVEVVDPTSVEA